MARVPFGRAGLLAMLACGSLHGRAQGLEPPLRVSVLSTRSATGTVTFSISGASAADCRALAQRIHVNGAQAVPALNELSPCSFAAVPSTALAAGNYCLTADQFTGTFGERCFEVTNLHGDLSKARVVLEDNGEDIWSNESCRECTNPNDGRICTQRARGRNLIAIIEEVEPEAASEFTFAVTYALDGEATREPESKDFVALDGRLSQALLLAQRDDAGPCATVFARPIGSEATTTVGRVCVAPVLPSVVPDTPLSEPSGCEPEFWTRWCQDNREVCAAESASSIPTCAGYADRCSSTPADGGSLDSEGGDDAGSNEGSGASRPDGQGSATSAERSAESAAKRRGGCQLGVPAGAADGRIALLLSGAAVALHRRRRR